MITAVTSIEATEAAASAVFLQLLPGRLKIMPVNAKNDEHKEKFSLYDQ